MTYLRNLWSALSRDGMDLDRTENVILAGEPGQTISLRCAIASAHKKLWAHIACVFLTFVQWRHCQDQLTGVPMKTGNYIRAIIALIGVPCGLIYGGYLFLHSIWTVL